MKELFNDNAILKLTQHVKTYSDYSALSPPESSILLPLSKNEAARIIQKTWRKGKIKQAMVKAPFDAYRSLIDSNDAQKQLSSIMLGRHVAETPQDAKEQIVNPLVNQAEYYHRSTPLDNLVLDALFKEFDLTVNKEKYSYIPISLLKNNPIEDVLALFSALDDIKLIQKEPYPLAILVIPKLEDELYTKLKDKIKNMGLVASSWEIAEYACNAVLEIATQTPIFIPLDSNLPNTREALLSSDIMVRLKAISKRKEYPTKLLAACLKELLSNLPSNISGQAIQRMVTMIEFTNIFYLYHYPRYALCVYYIIHEISLALVQNKEHLFLEQEFEKFKEETAHTLDTVLHINKENLVESHLLATASISGASACAGAMRLASNMIIPNDTRPKVKIFKPCYYELPNTFNLDSTEDANEADILMISVGPIVNPEGLTPGIDINRFVKHHVIDTKRNKPVTLIVDATTALYKNIRLDVEVQALIANGQMSIIIHESHQKFGLIHSDQAQYGRVFGWCSKKQFNQKILEEVDTNFKNDFFKHSDIRIGAFISSRCKDLLEKIKERHFINGSVLRKLLLGTSIISDHIEKHEDMQENLNELYFLTNTERTKGSFASNMEYAAFGAMEYRDSFGHYTLTSAGAVGLRRLSPNASDNIDNLLLASHMRLSRRFNYSCYQMLEKYMEHAKTKEELTLAQQIVLCGLIHSISSFCPITPLDFDQIQYIERAISQEERSQIMSSSKKLKNIIISKTEEGYIMGFHSHDKTFRKISIKDPNILELIGKGTINSPEGRLLIKKYFATLQQQYFPPGTNLLTLYSAVSKGLECCPLLGNRPFIQDINRWLNTLKNKITDEYQLKKPNNTMNAICALSSVNAGSEAMKFGLIFLNNIEPSLKASPIAFKNEQFISAIRKVYEGNQHILNSLEDAPHKLQLAQESGKRYLASCFHALHDYYIHENPTASQRLVLMSAIKKAENSYLSVLSKDRSQLSKLARYLLAAVTNFIGALTFGGAHYINYKLTGNALFFSGTRSENKLKRLDIDLMNNINIAAPSA